VVAADATTLSPPGADGTTGQCYSVNPITGDIEPVNPGVSTITSTVTFTIDSNDYVCQVTAGGQVCEMWGYTNGYGNNFDSQYIPFRCADIGGDAYEGYIAYVFDHRLLTPVFYGAGQAPQIVLRIGITIIIVCGCGESFGEMILPSTRRIGIAMSCHHMCELWFV
jgi:hypothetical protein